MKVLIIDPDAARAALVAEGLADVRPLAVIQAESFEAIESQLANLAPDVTDLYVERVRGDRVDTPQGPRPLDVHTETIKVAGGDPVKIDIRSSDHGPLISDPDPEVATDVQDLPGLPAATGGFEYAVALRWTALDPGRSADAVIAINRATNWQQFRRA